MSEEEPWHFTVIRAQGLRLLRPEKAWRPIVTAEVDRHHSHEIVLGCDGQNPNLKDTLRLSGSHVTLGTPIDIKMWHLSQSKKKGKKRKLVASATHTLGDLWKRQEIEQKLELRLTCQSFNTASNKKRATVSSRGKPQNGAILHVKLRAPPGFSTTQPLSSAASTSGYTSDLGYKSSSSGTSTAPPSTADELDVPSKSTITDTLTQSHSEQTLRRRRRKPKPKPFLINTDDEMCAISSGSESYDSEYCEEKDLIEDDVSSYFDDSSFSTLVSEEAEPSKGIYIVNPYRSYNPINWIAANLLPQYTERIETPPELCFSERVLSTFTMYSELKAAKAESQYEKIFFRLQSEWTYVGGSLIALAAVDTGVFAISPGSIMTVNNYARSAIAASSIASGLGIACDAWFLLRYTWADVHTFIDRARDVYSSYFFFALSARVPALCMFISALSLMSFLALVAFDAWPVGVAVVCFFVGVVMSMQFLVYGVHWCAKGIHWCVMGVGNGVVMVVRPRRAAVDLTSSKVAEVNDVGGRVIGGKSAA